MITVVFGRGEGLAGYAKSIWEVNIGCLCEATTCLDGVGWLNLHQEGQLRKASEALGGYVRFGGEEMPQAKIECEGRLNLNVYIVNL